MGSANQWITYTQDLAVGVERVQARRTAGFMRFPTTAVFEAECALSAARRLPPRSRASPAPPLHTRSIRATTEVEGRPTHPFKQSSFFCFSRVKKLDAGQETGQILPE